jgi:hypothetical protein
MGIADPHQRYADGTSKIAEHAAYEFVELAFIELGHLRLLALDCARKVRRNRAGRMSRMSQRPR